MVVLPQDQRAGLARDTGSRQSLAVERRNARDEILPEFDRPLMRHLRFGELALIAKDLSAGAVEAGFEVTAHLRPAAVVAAQATEYELSRVERLTCPREVSGLSTHGRDYAPHEQKLA